MAHHKSAIKRIRISVRNRDRNRHYKSRMRTQIKKLRDASNKEEAQELYRETTSLLDKLASKGIIHANKAANQKSKLQHWVDQLS